MEPRKRNICALGNGRDSGAHQITYELGTSRRVHQLPGRTEKGELPPHGAGSFHNPEHHQELVKRFEATLLNPEQENPHFP